METECFRNNRIPVKQPHHFRKKAGRQSFAVRYCTENQLLRRHPCRQGKRKIRCRRAILRGRQAHADFSKRSTFPVVIQPAFPRRSRKFAFSQSQHKNGPKIHSAGGFRRHHLYTGILPFRQIHRCLRQYPAQYFRQIARSGLFPVLLQKRGHLFHLIHGAQNGFQALQFSPDFKQG